MAYPSERVLPGAHKDHSSVVGGWHGKIQRGAHSDHSSVVCSALMADLMSERASVAQSAVFILIVGFFVGSDVGEREGNGHS